MTRRAGLDEVSAADRFVRPGGSLNQPGRRGWVRLTPADAERCLAYLAEAREFVTGLATR
ncbi:hypothetical protein [Streptomyces sp. NPDC001893]|uniref:hypothetical protein n=1 Tax=Streptomyces sp. NPDC001893 TaxID=3154530 RepID=UPI00332EAFF3